MTLGVSSQLVFAHPPCLYDDNRDLKITGSKRPQKTNFTLLDHLVSHISVRILIIWRTDSRSCLTTPQYRNTAPSKSQITQN